MTFGQLHKRFAQKIDKAYGGAPFQPEQKDRILNEAVSERLEAWAALVERTIQVRDALAALTLPPAEGAGKTVLRSQLPGYYRLLALNASWQNDEETGSPDWVAVPPVASETLARRSRSWIHALTDEEPGYVEYRQGGDHRYVIEGTTDADRWQAIYLKLPQVINGWTNPGGEWTDFTKWGEEQILNTARRIAFAELGDPAAYQIGQAEEK